MGNLITEKFEIQLEEWNPNDKSRTYDCYICSLLFFAKNETWESLFDEITNICRSNYTVSNDPVVIETEYHKYGFVRDTFWQGKRLLDFIDSHKEGSYIIKIGSHYFAYQDGIVYDRANILKSFDIILSKNIDTLYTKSLNINIKERI